MENNQSNMQVVLVDQDGDGNDGDGLPPGISVANFDYSVENHLKAMDKILELSGESKFDYDQSEIQRMSSSVTFLRYFANLLSCVAISVLVCVYGL